MKKNNIHTMLLAITMIVSSGVSYASVNDITKSVSSIKMKDITKVVSNFNQFLGSVDVDAPNLGDLVQAQLDPLVAMTTAYINNNTSGMAKSTLNAGLKELTKFANKSIKGLNNSSNNSAATKKWIKELQSAVNIFSMALSTAQMLGAK